MFDSTQDPGNGWQIVMSASQLNAMIVAFSAAYNANGLINIGVSDPWTSGQCCYQYGDAELILLDELPLVPATQVGQTGWSHCNPSTGYNAANYLIRKYTGGGLSSIDSSSTSFGSHAGEYSLGLVHCANPTTQVNPALFYRPHAVTTFDGGTTALSPEPGKLVGGSGWGVGVWSSTAISAASSLKGVAFTCPCYNQCNGGGVQYGMLGLASGTGTTSYGEIDFGIFLYAGELQVREEGTIVFGQVGNKVSDWTQGTGWNPAVGNRVSVWEVRISAAGTIQYVRDGNVFHTSTRAIVWPLHVTADFASSSGGFENIQYLTAADQAGWDVAPAPPSAPSCPAIPPAALSSISDADNLPDGQYEVRVSDCSSKVLQIVHLVPGQAWAIAMYKSGCCTFQEYGATGDPPTYSDHDAHTQLAGRQHPLFTTDAVGDALTFTNTGNRATYSVHNFKLSDSEMNYLTSQPDSVGVFLVPGWNPDTPTQNTQGNLIRANDGSRAYPIGGSTAGSTNHDLHVETAPGTDIGDLAKFDPSASTAYPSGWGTSLHDNAHCGGPAVWSWNQDYTTAWAFRWSNYGGCSWAWGGCSNMPNGITDAHPDCQVNTWIGRLYAFAR